MKKLHIVTGAVLALAISAHGYGQGSQLPKYTVATLPSAASYKSFTVQVIDGISDTDCTVGGATGTSAHNALCSAQWNGSAYVWVPVASSAIDLQHSAVDLPTQTRLNFVDSPDDLSGGSL